MGYTPRQFDDMTPRELWLCARGFRDAEHRRMRQRQELAYNTAVAVSTVLGSALGGSRIPEFEELFPKKGEEHAAMSEQEMLARVEALNTALGGSVR